MAAAAYGYKKLSQANWYGKISANLIICPPSSTMLHYV